MPEYDQDTEATPSPLSTPPDAGGREPGAGERELTTAEVELIEAWKQSPEGKSFIRDEHRRRLDHITSDVRRALSGDASAKNNLGPDGRRFYKLVEATLSERDQAYQTDLATRIRTTIQSVDDYNNLAAIKKADPLRFDQMMNDPRTAQFWAGWTATRAQLGMAEGRPFTANQQQQVVQQAAVAAASTELEEAYDDLRGDADASVLTAEQWDKLVPEKFSHLAPKEAVKAWTRAARNEMAQAQARKLAAPTAAAAVRANTQAQAARTGSGVSIPTVSGSTSVSRMTDAEVENHFLQVYRDGGELTPELLEQVAQSRSRRGLTTMVGR